MAREEILVLLKEMKQNTINGAAYDDPKRERKFIALDEAIKALEQEPCEDAISRQDTLKTIIKHLGIRSEEYLLPAEKAIYKVVLNMPPVTPRSLNPEADREESKAYCAECDHIEMCSWYPHDGCEWLKTDRYNAGYNAAKREIALSGEYERAYERGKADAQPKQTECEDAISREDALMCMTGEFLPFALYKPEDIISKRIQRIKALPPVQPKIKTGHWIHRSTDEYGGITTWYECSECGRSVEDIYHVYGEYPYCHCGAKMIEPQAESEGKE